MNKNYIDITDELVNNITHFNHEIKKLDHFIDKDGIRYDVDGKNVVLD